MNREMCSNGHRFREDDKFCGVCGEDRLGARSRCPKCGHEDEPNLNFCTQCRSPLVVVGAAAAATDSIEPSSFGRNHDVFARAVVGHEGEVLNIAALEALIRVKDPDFKKGSLLPNDHGGGNKASCGCTAIRNGKQVRPIFEWMGRGLYRVIDYTNAPGEATNQGRGVRDLITPSPIQGAVPLTAAGWLLGPAAARINDELEDGEPARILVGQKGGRWVALGKKLPSHDLTLGYGDAWWAIGIERRTMDYVLGEPPKKEPMYLGLRYDRNVGGLDGALIYNTLSKILPGKWKRADRWWPIWTEPNAFDEDGKVLSQDDYIDAVISKYVETYAIISEYFQST
jgi:hypothetical protein